MAIVNYIEKHLKTFSVTSHKHHYWEIIYVTEGSGKIKTQDNTVVEYKKGEIICIPPNLQHLNYSSSGFKNIHCTIEDWTPSISTIFLIKESALTKDFYSLFKLLHSYAHSLPANHPINLSLYTCITEFLNHLLNESTTSKQTQIIANEIMARYTDSKFDIDDAYKLIPLSKEYLRKIFIQEHGISPSNFLTSKRIALAKQLILKKKDNNLRISEIAELSGFDDLAYFSRIFKKETGFAPTEYELKHLKTNKIESEER